MISEGDWDGPGERPMRTTDRETLIRDLLDGQYLCPAWIVAFNAAEGWSRDATQDIADELWERCAGEIPVSLRDFLDRYPSRPKARQLKLWLLKATIQAGH